MKIKRITLYTHQLEAQKSFYNDVLGFELTKETSQSFSVQAGWTELTFHKSDTVYIYHYCFMIPSNRLFQAIQWLQNKTDLIKIEGDRIIERFESWNANSIYFYDGAGNIAEFIVRHDLKNEKQDAGFSLTDIICLNEIGVVSGDISTNNQTLETKFDSKIWRGNAKAFGANGTQEGLFLLINYNLKKSWFPTDITPQSCPFHGDFEFSNGTFSLEFKNEIISLRDDYSGDGETILPKQNFGRR